MVASSVLSSSDRRWTHVVVAAAAVWALCASSSLKSEVARPTTGSALLDSAAQAQTRSVWDGAYTEGQAKRGGELYSQECGSCHGQTLAGGEAAPSLLGSDFIQEWAGLTVGDLFERIRVAMPQDSPGRLSRQQCADIVARILNANEFPAGESELGTDAAVLKQVLIQEKPAAK
jgi:mono/diheme cytochrome c family protein